MKTVDRRPLISCWSDLRVETDLAWLRYLAWVYLAHMRIFLPVFFLSPTMKVALVLSILVLLIGVGYSFKLSDFFEDDTQRQSSVEDQILPVFTIAFFASLLGVLWSQDFQIPSSCMNLSQKFPQASYQPEFFMTTSFHAVPEPLETKGLPGIFLNKWNLLIFPKISPLW